MTGATEDILVPSCLKTKIETLDGQLIDIPRIEFVMPGQSNRPVYVSLTSKKVMDEPAIRFSITMICGSTVRRDYTLLLDYPDSPVAIPRTAPVSEAPVAQAVAIEEKRNPVRSVGSARKAPTRPAAVSDLPDALPKSSKEPARTVHRREAVARDVLKVDNYDSVADPDLKMSRMLSDSGSSAVDQQRSAENRLAQAQFAAIMHGEDPLLAAQNDVKREQLKAKNLQDELNRVRQQAALKDANGNGPSSLLIGLIAAVAALLLVLTGLIAYALRRSRKTEEKSWWDASADQKKNVEDIVDYLQSSAEQGGLDPNPITTFRDNSAADQAVKADTAPGSVNQAEPAAKFKRTGLPALEDTNSSTFNFFTHRGQSIHIEEVSDITQEAEFWMSVNDPHRAIEILEPQSRDENPGTPVPWLYLLDLYRLVGDEDNYRDLRQRFKHKFNARIPNFHEEITPGSVRSFEDFPHLVTNCTALWATDDISAYLESLLIDDREGERIGFDLPVYRDILFLLGICNELKRVQYESKSAPEDIKPAPVLPQLDAHLVVKPDDADSGVQPESLNFDLLDFKAIGKDNN